jgi:hypothetical protein
MKRFRVYVIGATTFLTVEHPAETVQDLYTSAMDTGFVAAVALERNGRKRNVLVTAQSLAIVAEVEDRELRAPATVRSRRLS